MEKRRKVKPRKASGGAGAAVSIAVSAVVMFIVFAAIIAGLASLMCKVDIPYSALNTAAAIALCLGTLAGGVIFAAINGEHGVLGGAILGLCAFLIVLIIGMLSSVTPSSFAMTKALSMVVCGAVGGFLGDIISRRRKKIR